jgi:hypothetical protein
MPEIELALAGKKIGAEYAAVVIQFAERGHEELARL